MYNEADAYSEVQIEQTSKLDIYPTFGRSTLNFEHFHRYRFRNIMRIYTWFKTG
jgi:hypothetical protein